MPKALRSLLWAEQTRILPILLREKRKHKWIFGSTEVDVTDIQGHVNKIKFSRPEEVEIDVEVNITITDSSQFPASTEDAKIK